ncbi:MAG: (deoxy)nucleoside triphosphate pyrophosphohydrolase [bacterium]|nr:(deoxy)nucleoside triphosphate pyrophosphohydrolase [bacterium]
MSDKKDCTEIGVAIIRRGDLVLVGKRPSSKLFGGKWEFPGGKLEPLESPEKCIIREIQEELGVKVGNLKLLVVRDHEYPDGKKFRLHFYFCEISEEEPRALWHDEILWIEPEKLDEVDILTADTGLNPLIQAEMTQRG